VKGLRFVVGFLIVATVISLGAMLLLYAIVSQEPEVPAHATLVLNPSGDLPEIVSDFSLGAGSELSIRAYVELIRKAKHDTRIKRILLKPGGLTSPFWAKVQELRDAIKDFKTSGKPVDAWLEYAGDREYYLASIADHVYLLPSASLDLTGVASYEVFLRGTFDWIGTYPDFLHVGDYKTAVNTYLEKTFTPAHKEMSESLNRSQYDQLVRAVADARRRAR
jgi:protease-4